MFSHKKKKCRNRVINNKYAMHIFIRLHFLKFVNTVSSEIKVVLIMHITLKHKPSLHLDNEDFNCVLAVFPFLQLFVLESLASDIVL